MHNRFRQSPTKWLLTFVIVVFTIAPLQWSYGIQQPSDQEVLQHFLTIYEVEKEIERVVAEEGSLQNELTTLSAHISDQQARIEYYKQRAAKIARAYYMGDRNDLLILLFSLDDLQQFLRLYDTVSYLFEKDEEELLAFHREVTRLQTLHADKEQALKELRETQAHLYAQKAMMGQLHSELDILLSGVSDKEMIALLQQQLIRDWEERGIPTFDMFLQTISSSMSGMATELTDHISFSFTGAKITISDQLFTSLLQKQNSLFHDFRIRFENEQLTFFGTYEDIVLTMTGEYQLESEELVRFNVLDLKYNGFHLPPSTAKALETQYDLGIYPQYIHERLVIKDVTIKDGELHISFTLRL